MINNELNVILQWIARKICVAKEKLIDNNELNVILHWIARKICVAKEKLIDNAIVLPIY